MRRVIATHDNHPQPRAYKGQDRTPETPHTMSSPKSTNPMVVHQRGMREPYMQAGCACLRIPSIHGLGGRVSAFPA
jgi:hypothetical protein